MGGEKLLLAYSCMIMEIYLAIRVQALLGIDELDPIDIRDLRLIRDAASPIGKQDRQRFKIIAEMLRKSGHFETPEATEKGLQAEPQTSNTAGIPSTPPLVQSVPPQPDEIINGLIMISQDMLDEVMKRLSMLKAKVEKIKGVFNL